MRLYFPLVLSLSFGLSACNANIFSHGPTRGNGPSAETFSLQTPIDSKLIQTSILGACLDCHRQTSPRLDSLAGIRVELGRTGTDVNNDSMPPQDKGYRPLSRCKKAILRKWIQLNAPDTTGLTVGSLPECVASQRPLPPLGTAPLAYKTMLERILKPKCMKCHNSDDPTAAASENPFFPYENFRAQTTLFTRPGATSGFIVLTTRTDDDRMPPPDSAVPPLTDEEVQFVIRYIDAGIPEN